MIGAHACILVRLRPGRIRKKIWTSGRVRLDHEKLAHVGHWLCLNKFLNSVFIRVIFNSEYILYWCLRSSCLLSFDIDVIVVLSIGGAIGGQARLGEGTSPCFEKFGHSLPRFWEKIYIKLSPILGQNTHQIFSDFGRKYNIFSHFLPFSKITPSCFLLFAPPLFTTEIWIYSSTF